MAYSVVFGGYETLNEQPELGRSDIPFVCFTDNPLLTSSRWQIVLVQPRFLLDPVRSQRELKIRGNSYLRGFDETLYLDNSVTLKVDPAAILDSWLNTADFAAILHSYREHVIDEFDAVIASNFDDPARVQEQLMEYAVLFPDVLAQKPLWTGLMARRNTEHVQSTMELWFDQVLRFSRRDQLSVNVALASTGLVANTLSANNLNSDLHFWPTDVQRNASMANNGPRKSAPLLAEIARQSREIIRRKEDNDRLREENLRRKEELRVDFIELDRLQTTIIALSRDRLEQDERAHELRAEVTELRSELRAIKLTRSWKITIPFRYLRSLLSPRHSTGS